MFVIWLFTAVLLLISKNFPLPGRYFRLEKGCTSFRGTNPLLMNDLAIMPFVACELPMFLRLRATRNGFFAVLTIASLATQNEKAACL